MILPDGNDLMSLKSINWKNWVLSFFQPDGETFQFPNIFPEKEKEKKDKEQEESQKASKVAFKKFLDKNKNRPGLPGWFSI